MSFHRCHRQLKGVFLTQGDDPSHTAAQANEYLANCDGWWRPRLTPTHASWLNQAELFNNAFSLRYLKRQSWNSREALKRSSST